MMTTTATTKIISFFTILFSFSTMVADQITLERPDLTRMDNQFCLYSSQKKIKKYARLAGIGALVAGTAGIGGWAIYKSVKGSDDGGKTKSSSDDFRPAKKQKNFWTTLKKAFFQTIAFSVSAIVVDSLLAGIFGAGRYVKKLFGTGKETCPELAPLSIRIINSFKSLRESMIHLNESTSKEEATTGNWLKNHCLSNIDNAFKTFAFSIEKISAILLWKAGQLNEKNRFTLINCKKFIERLFLLSDKVAETIEKDLNDENSKEISPESFVLIDLLEKVSVTFMTDYSDGQCWRSMGRYLHEKHVN
jgi:hypothetical protein